MTLPVYYLIDDDLLSVPQIIEKYKECLKRIKELEEQNKESEVVEDNLIQEKRKRGRPKKEKQIEIKIAFIN